MNQSTSSSIYLDSSGERISQVRDELETELPEHRLTVRTALEDWESLVDHDTACLVVGVDSETDAAAVRLLETVTTEYPSVSTIALASADETGFIEDAYDAGADEVVQYTGPGAIRILAHHLRKFAAVEDATSSAVPPHAHFRELVEATDDAIVTIDVQSEIHYATSGLEDVLGYAPEEVVGDSLTRLMSDEMATRHVEGLRQYLETGERSLDWTDVELVGRHREGHDVPLSVSFAELTVNGQRYFTGILRDISERSTLRNQRELLRDTSRHILQADTFEEGLAIAVQEVGQALGWSYGEAWRPDGDRLERATEWYGETESAQEFAGATESSVFERGVGTPGRAWETGETQLVTDLTGSDTRFERSSLASDLGLETAYAVPITTDGNVVAVLLFMTDRSQTQFEQLLATTRAVVSDLGLLMDRLQVEEELRREREFRDRILDTNPTGILVLDAQGQITYANDHAIDILDLPDPDQQFTYTDLDIELVETNVEWSDSESESPYQAVIESGASFNGEFQVDVHGERRWLLASGSPLRGPSGEITRAVFSIRDQTERKERERRLARHEALSQAVGDGLYALDDEDRFLTVNDAYLDLLGYDREELLGRKAEEFVSEQVSAEAQRLQSTLETGQSAVQTLETTLETADGESIPVEVRLSLFPIDDDRSGRVGVVRDISDRKRREERLELLNEVSQALTAVETPKEVADVVTETAAETLGLPVTTVELYDPEPGRLESAARTSGVTELVGDGPLFESERDIPWRVYAESDGRVFDNLSDVDGVDEDETPLESAIVLPIGTHGVFITGSPSPDAFTDTEVTTAEILASNARAALDRVDREQELRSQKQRLEQQNDALERVERINGVIRNITQSLTHATSREEIEQAVCTELATHGPYTFSWIAAQTSVVGDEVTARASAGEGDDYLDVISVSTDDETSTGDGPTGRAFRSHEPQVQENLNIDPPFDPWRVAALERNFRSSVAVPITYNEKLYGVLNIYASQTDMFDDMEVDVLEELGEMVGYAINAMERKKMLVSDTAVALEFKLDDTDIPAIRFVQEMGGRFEFDEIVQQTDSGYRVFFTISGVDPETVYEYSDHVTSVRDLTFISETDDSIRFEAIVEESGFLGDILSYGAYPREMSASSEGTRIEVELPRSGDIQSFIQLFLNSYEGAELLARQERNQPVQTREEFEAVYREALTMRQEEVIKTAYYSGFFEWPRENTGQEIAEMLDVSQPTVNRHIRNSERKLLDIVFDDSKASEG